MPCACRDPDRRPTDKLKGVSKLLLVDDAALDMASPCDANDGGSAGDCTAIFVSTHESACVATAPDFCYQASLFYQNTTMEEPVGGGWGVFVSILCDCVISIGLALQVCCACSHTPPPGR